MKRSLARTAAALAALCGAWACGGRIDGDGLGQTGVGDPAHGSASRTVDAGRPNGAEGGAVTPSPPRDCTVPVPPLIQPLSPIRPVDVICAATTGTPAPSDTPAVIQATIVGRWVSCNLGAPNALEIGGNGRYQYLQKLPDGTLAPMSPKQVGRYDLYGQTQVNMTADGDSLVYLDSVTFPTGTDSMFLRGELLFARVAASPLNGTDNPPPLSSGSCTLEGTWDFTAGGRTLSSFTFDAHGHFMGGEEGTDLCASHAFTGTYQLSPGLFEIGESQGMGCAYDAFWTPQFDASCTHVTLTGRGDNCTGARNFTAYDGAMTRRP